MKVFDPQNLIDKWLLEIVTKHHPLYHDIGSELNILTVHEKEGQDIFIQMDDKKNVDLHIKPIIQPTQRDKYILYHEFGHIADRLNPYFRYDHNLRLTLSHIQEKNLLELWNVYIDTRLNQHGLFSLPQSGQIDVVVDGVKYRLPRSDTNTYLLEAIAHLSQRGFQKPGLIVTDIWNNPGRFLTFRDLTSLVL